jgi:S1-C subfamily serine protease
MKRFSVSSLMCCTLFLVFSLHAADLHRVVCKRVNSDGEKYSLGVAIGKLDEDQKKETGLKGGALILEVLRDGEADKIGLKEDDIITRFDGQEIASPRQLYDIIAGINKEKTVDIVVYRDGKKLDFRAELKPQKPKEVTVHFQGDDLDLNLPDLDSLQGKIMEAIPHFNEKGGFLGVMTENLTDQLKKYFDVQYGVMVKEVIEDSPAEKAGILAGDIITEINDRKIEDTGDLRRTLNFYNAGDPINLIYNRRGKKNELKITLGDKKGFAILPEWIGGETMIRIPDIRIEKEKIRDLQKEIKDLKIDVEVYII